MVTALKLIELLGIVAFAVSGIIEGRKKRLDIIGIYFVALITAFGGGTIRDVLLNNYPIFWIGHPEYPALILVLCLTSYLGRGAIFNNTHMLWTVVIFDALGLGLFCASGISLSLTLGTPTFIAGLMGIITGAFGGVIRDIICNEIPVVFRRTELYVTCILFGVFGYYTIFYLGNNQLFALITCIALTFTSRILAHRYQWRLPV